MLGNRVRQLEARCWLAMHFVHALFQCPHPAAEYIAIYTLEALEKFKVQPLIARALYDNGELWETEFMLGDYIGKSGGTVKGADE